MYAWFFVDMSEAAFLPPLLYLFVPTGKPFRVAEGLSFFLEIIEYVVAYI